MPDLTRGTGPVYQRLADQIEAAIESGELPAGAKLPPQRNLAFDLGLTIGTIGRAYQLVHERGLVAGEVGRGTFVLDRADRSAGRPTDPIATALSGTRTADPPPGKLRMDTTAPLDVGQSQAIADMLEWVVRHHAEEISSYSRTLPRSWSEAGQIWLSRAGFRPEIDTIVPTLGAHAAAITVVAALSAPGDKILFEDLSYTQVSRGARLLGRRLVTVEADREGMRPDDFERVCQQQHPKIAFLMPTGQNPTLSIMPEARRRAIVDIARRHSVWLIEDDVYGALTDDPTPPIAALAPERTFFLGSLSKSVAAGLRGGWVACPPHLAQRIRVTHKTMTGGLPFMLAETSAQMVLCGHAARIRSEIRQHVSQRASRLKQILHPHEFEMHPQIPFFWLKLPEPWLSGTFKNAAYWEGLLIDDEDEFKVMRGDKIYHRARISLSTPGPIGLLEDGLSRIRRLLEGGDSSYAVEG